MRFFTAVIASALAVIAAAQNPFTMSTLPTSISVGTSYSITWTPSTSGTISILLVQGPSTNLKVVSTITSGHANDGSFTWVLPSTIVKGSNYALQIVSDTNINIYNYSGQFAIDSTNTATAAATSAAASSAVVTTVRSVSSADASVSSASGSTSTASRATSSISTVTKPVSSTTSSGVTATTASTSSSTSPSATAKNGAGAVKVGGGLLAVVAVVMCAM